MGVSITERVATGGTGVDRTVSGNRAVASAVAIAEARSSWDGAGGLRASELFLDMVAVPATGAGRTPICLAAALSGSLQDCKVSGSVVFRSRPSIFSCNLLKYFCTVSGGTPRAKPSSAKRLQNVMDNMSVLWESTAKPVTLARVRTLQQSVPDVSDGYVKLQHSETLARHARYL
jgi:hypothetical protein